MEYDADTTSTASKNKKDTEEGRATRLKEDEKIMKVIRRICHKSEDAGNPLKAFTEVPKLSGLRDGCSAALVSNVMNFVCAIQTAWHKLPVEARTDLVTNRRHSVVRTS